MEAEKGESFICYNCGYTAYTKRTLIKHIKVGNCNLKTDTKKSSITANLHVCTQCSKEFAKKRNLDSHIVKKHPEMIPSLSRKIYECKDCDYKAVWKCNFSRHILTHQDASNYRLSCPHCNATFREGKAVDDHIVKKHPEFVKSVKRRIYECPNCPYKTVKKAVLDMHLTTHPDAVSSIKMRTCPHCNKSFKKNATLDNHILKEHPEFMASVTKKIYQCPYCPYRTVEKAWLDRHFITHSDVVSGIKLMKCEHCNKSFKQKVTLDNHILHKHPEFMSSVTKKIHQCPYCPYRTVEKGGLNRHLITHSDAVSGIKVIKCEHCNKSFKKQVKLDNHILKEHPEFMSSVTNEIHQCPYCPYRTVEKAGLDRHLITHSDGIKLIKCEHCNKSFKQKQSLYDHIVRKHPDFISSITVKIHECAHCPFKTIRKTDLKLHETIHLDAN
ncbi:unnamed protein product [Acanthoscelides obtectus]|uniref:C2H2-type domain-containing protein n=1 Tax=Acanthoscelides obtectus TaxID=200917 RepID=A0A9P0PD85_ACAOB|nr:unnamed protein product [Acanthoscelides obtectus]CAK1675750.1 Zinc finger protein 711 [Acanthoscelides obtectus]